MIPLTLREVAAACDGRVVGDPGLRIADVVTDSREVDREDALFVALPGEQADGHRFVQDAVASGAIAALVQHADALAGADGTGGVGGVGGVHGVVVEDTWTALGRLGAAVRDRVDPDVVAVTGSVGKTTTKDLTRGALAADRPTVAARGSYNNELGVPLTLLATEATTRALVVEVGARGVGHIAALAPLVRPDVAIVTAVAGAHLEQFGDLDGVAAAKGELVEALEPDGTAVLNADDARVAAMAGRSQADVVTYGRRASADCSAGDVRLDELGRPSFTAHTPWGRAECTLRVAGAHNVDNALAALAAAGALGVPVEVAAEGLATAAVSPWRGAVELAPSGLVVCNDAYNANPTSVLAALQTLAALRREGGRAIAVLGIMAELGDAADAGHEEVGRAAARTADLVVAVGDVAALARAARDEGGADVVEADDVAAALAHLREVVAPEDAVLVKGSRVAGLEAVAAGLLGPGLRGPGLLGEGTT